jgi:hypothetical protein
MGWAGYETLVDSDFDGRSVGRRRAKDELFD